VLRARPTPEIRTIALADVRSAVVEVEFSRPDPAELALTGMPRGSDAAAERADEIVLDNEETT